jgi:hypothetical protein
MKRAALFLFHNRKYVKRNSLPFAFPVAKSRESAISAPSVFLPISKLDALKWSGRASCGTGSRFIPPL